MKITVINGTEKRGVTYRLKELFLAPLREKAEIKEWYLPKDLPEFCTGCAACVTAGETKCRSSRYAMPIWKSLEAADLIVITSPVYVMHASGAVKNLLDHYAWNWLPHRPKTVMFGKRALVLTQAFRSGNGSAAADIADSLKWWGVGDVKRFATTLTEGTVWEELSEKKRRAMEARLLKLADTYEAKDYTLPAKTPLAIKMKFRICRMLQKSAVKKKAELSLDSKYWQERGWLDGERPWKQREAEMLKMKKENER